MATYVIGDVQGCVEPLKALLKRIHFKADADQLLFAGDLVNRGGGSLSVLRMLYQMRDNVEAVLGNHDLSLLLYAANYRGGPLRPNAEFAKICEAPDGAKLIKWVRKRPVALLLEKFNSLLVHAGIAPPWSLEQTLSVAGEIQDALSNRGHREAIRKMYGNHPLQWSNDLAGSDRLCCGVNFLTRLRFLDSDGRIILKHHGPPGSQPDHVVPWFKHPSIGDWSTRIIFGHWSALGLYQTRRVVGLDTGCVWGGALTALRLNDDRPFQVPGINRS